MFKPDGYVIINMNDELTNMTLIDVHILSLFQNKFFHLLIRNLLYLKSLLETDLTP